MRTSSLLLVIPVAAAMSAGIAYWAYHEYRIPSWLEAQSYVANDRERAEWAFRRLIATHNSEAAASHALGLILWDQGRTKEAEYFLRVASTTPEFSKTYDGFVRSQQATDKLRVAEAAEARDLGGVGSQEKEATENEYALYRYLNKFDCDVRQFSGWSQYSDKTLKSWCSSLYWKNVEAQASTYIAEGLAFAVTGGALGLLGRAARAGRIAMGAEAVEGAVLAERITANGARFQRLEAATMENGIAMRRYTYITGFDSEFRAALSAEQGIISEKIALSYQSKRAQIVELYRPTKQSASGIISAEDANRRKMILNIENTKIDVSLTAPLIAPGNACSSDNADDRCRERGVTAPRIPK